MIQSIQIKNFKSVVDLSLELGSFNVLIGENGCGKSNILEAMAFGAAASADKLDYEFLGSRGIRATNPEFMFSAFANTNTPKIIDIVFNLEETRFNKYSYKIINEQNNPRKWVIENLYQGKVLGQKIESILFADEEIKDQQKKELTGGDKDMLTLFNSLEKDFSENREYFRPYYNLFIKERFENDNLSEFVIYSLDENSLRKNEASSHIYPLGIRGEGLFQYLKELGSNKKNKKIIDGIKENMLLLDWYEDFDLGDNLLSNEFSLKIKDKYLNEHLQYFDQRSTNEGFLYLLFYSTLFISKETPTFFAIDNIDASFNPKLCVQLIKSLASLAKKHKKQVIVTTHNPAVLDGLNLKDDKQRLFVISRNGEGYTRAERINYNENRTMRLSEIWTKGFIGGLPENF